MISMTYQLKHRPLTLHKHWPLLRPLKQHLFLRLETDHLVSHLKVERLDFVVVVADNIEAVVEYSMEAVAGTFVADFEDTDSFYQSWMQEKKGYINAISITLECKKNRSDVIYCILSFCYFVQLQNYAKIVQFINST